MWYKSVHDSSLKRRAEPTDTWGGFASMSPYVVGSHPLKRTYIYLRTHHGDPTSASAYERASWKPVCETQALLEPK